jgi:hypothetical protein
MINLNKQDLKVLAVVGGSIGNMIIIILFYWNWFNNPDFTQMEIIIHNKEYLFLIIPFSLLIFWGGDSENFKL